MLIFGGITGWVEPGTKDRRGKVKGRVGSGCGLGCLLMTFLNTLADPPGQRNGVTEMPQSSGVHMDGGLC